MCLRVQHEGIRLEVDRARDGSGTSGIICGSSTMRSTRGPLVAVRMVVIEGVGCVHGFRAVRRAG